MEKENIYLIYQYFVPSTKTRINEGVRNIKAKYR